MLFFYMSLIDTDEGKDKFRLLHNEYLTTMKYIAYSVLGNDLRADEAVVDSLTALAKAVNDGRIDDVYSKSTKGYVCIVTKNHALKLLQSRDKLYSIEQTSAQTEDDSAEILAHDLMDAVRKMPDRYRDVIMLRVLYGMSTRETAKALGISEAAVRKRFERARELLSDYI